MRGARRGRVLARERRHGRARVGGLALEDRPAPLLDVLVRRPRARRARPAPRAPPSTSSSTVAWACGERTTTPWSMPGQRDVGDVARGAGDAPRPGQARDARACDAQLAIVLPGLAARPRRAPSAPRSGPPSRRSSSAAWPSARELLGGAQHGALDAGIGAAAAEVAAHRERAPARSSDAGSRPGARSPTRPARPCRSRTAARPPRRTHAAAARARPRRRDPRSS